MHAYAVANRLAVAASFLDRVSYNLLICPRSSRLGSVHNSAVFELRSSSSSSFIFLHSSNLGGGGGHISKDEGRRHMAATVVTTTGKVVWKNLISRTLQRCKSGLSGGGSSGRSSSPPGCFSVYVGPERERFVVRAECANHQRFRRLLDDAEREYGYVAQGPLALPGCDVDAFLDVLWQMKRADADEEVAGAASSPICGLHSGRKGGAAGYRMLSPRSSPMVGRRR